MPEFWESAFQDKQAMWGFAPADSAVAAAHLFAEKGFKDVLIPGFGYGRNAVPFREKGITVTGIEISETAIELAKNHFGESIKVHHGSVSNMPFDEDTYDGLFCYALIHLLDAPSRTKLIAECYKALRQGGIMVFISIAPSSPTFGEGEQIAPNTYRTRHGVDLFYFDPPTISEAFRDVGLTDFIEIQEPATSGEGKPIQRFWWIQCRK